VRHAFVLRLQIGRLLATAISADKQGFPQIIEEEVLISQSHFHPCLSADKILGVFGFLSEIAIMIDEKAPHPFRDAGL
jgi:hypothetical protein